MKSLFGKLFGESEAKQLATENKQLRERQFKQVEYIRSKSNQLLILMGTLPIRPEEFDDDNLIEADPIGTIADAFVQILEHQQELNERLRTAHDEIQAIMSSVGIGILVLDSSMRIKMYNQKIMEFFPLHDQNLIGRPCSQAVCGMPIMPADCIFGRIMETGRPCHQTNRVLAGRHFDVAGVPIKNRFGDITQVIMAYTDITGRIEAENKLREREL
jgi:PAS domain S-box-containing protein